MLTRHFFIGILCVALLGAAACASGQEKEPAPGQAADSASTGEPAIGNNDLTEATGEILYESAAGDFSVSFPPGCARYRERLVTSEAKEQGFNVIPMVVYAYCDRQERKNEGCSVAAYVDEDLEEGTPADRDFVLDRIQAILREYSVEVVEQMPVHKILEDGPRVEGLDVLATDPQKKGQVWVRGLLVEGDVYILVAWRANGELAVDPEIVAFFESFRAHT